ncbi:hypothetical protein EUX98_g7261 [Antrodiella citrinella]|uniref:Uncharacterized protein n=1 Tax=Antrodiella citrinella TaxID=2447956 RepID=A0A4V3XHW4_9APHY|nr:hypothetical protein EUX98_g7261 [Antrodiella citrinella]
MASVNLQTVAPNQFFPKAVEAYPHLASTIKAVSTGNILVSASQCKLNFVLDNISGVAECTKWTTGAANNARKSDPRMPPQARLVQRRVHCNDVYAHCPG